MTTATASPRDTAPMPATTATTATIGQNTDPAGRAGRITQRVTAPSMVEPRTGGEGSRRGGPAARRRRAECAGAGNHDRGTRPRDQHSGRPLESPQVPT